MTSRERVLAALNFQPVDRLPKDLGGMLSTGISAFAYPHLVTALDLPPRRPRVHDTHQMLAFPDMDVLDALGCDVVSVFNGATNAMPQPEKWQDYDFNGRLPARVRDAASFQDHPDGRITQPQYDIEMPTSSYVFNSAHSGQPMDLSADLPKPDLKTVQTENRQHFPTDEAIQELIDLCRQARQATDKAIFLSGPMYASIAITAPGGLAVWPMICLTEPSFVADYHGIMTENALKIIDVVLPELHPYIDIIMLDGDDWGTQNALMAPPRVYEELFLPFLKQVNARVHQIAPQIKTFLHSCGAVYEIIDMIIEAGFDILNPVQWTAGGKSYAQWKDKCRRRIALWGGGVDTQHTLPLGTVADVTNEVSEIVPCLMQDGGYVFNAIHNLLAETPPEKVIALYRAAEAADR